jgi:limonene-1,2-epoxide hydrolase
MRQGMKRQHIEFLWTWLDAVRRHDTRAMAAALDPEVFWQGVRPELRCHGTEEVMETYLSGVDALGEVESLELHGAEQAAVLVARGSDLGEIGGVALGSEICNVFKLENDRIVRIEDYLRSEEALAAAGIPLP